MSFLKFTQIPNPGRLTKQWAVTNAENQSLLGHVHFRAGWRKYVFNSFEAEYDAKCLTEITNFLIEHADDRQEQS